MASNKKKILVTISAGLALVAGILATSEKIINSSDAIYSKMSSKIKDLVVVDILVCKADGDILEKFGFYNGTVSNNIVETHGNNIYIKPEQDIFTDKSAKTHSPIQSVHYGPYIAYDEGNFVNGWVPSYPVLDIVISQNNIKTGLNIAEVRFSINQKKSSKDDTPYIEIVGEQAVPGTLTAINQGWSKIQKAKIDYRIIGIPGKYEETYRNISNINPENIIFDKSVELSELEKGKNMQQISLKNEICNTFGNDLNYYDKQIQKEIQRQDKIRETTDDYLDFPYCQICLGVVGRIFATGINSEGKIIPYIGYFRGIIALATEGGFGGGGIEINARNILCLKSDMSLNDYSIPATFRLDEKTNVYRAQIMLVSDKSAEYDFRYSIIGNGNIIYKSPSIRAHIFTPMSAGTEIYTKLYH